LLCAEKSQTLDDLCDIFDLTNILIPNVAEKNILILVEEKKNLIQSFCHNVMLDSGQNAAFCIIYPISLAVATTLLAQWINPLRLLNVFLAPNFFLLAPIFFILGANWILGQK
jgi:hypothetical protein